MSKIFIIPKKQLFAGSVLLIMMLTSCIVWLNESSLPAMQTSTPRTIHMVTGEFSATTKEGKKIESYRWDPGTIVVKQGELIELRIYGVNGESHPFMIEGMNIKDEVVKGKETVVQFTATEKGIFRIVCMKHPDIAHEGPMIGYLVVQ